MKRGLLSRRTVRMLIDASHPSSFIGRDAAASLKISGFVSDAASLPGFFDQLHGGQYQANWTKPTQP